MQSAIWGKFRSWERQQDPRMTRAGLAGARAAFEAELPTAADAQAFFAKLQGDERQGALAFARWLANFVRQPQSLPKGGMTDHSHTSDHVEIQLMR